MKVMNALWGAGQMMFNKMLFVFDENVKITDYKSLAKIISQRVRIPEDIFISRGPLDVLDHASAKYAVGGKIGFDITSEPIQNLGPAMVQKERILSERTEIIEVYDELLKDSISVLLIRYQKSQKRHSHLLAQYFIDNDYIQNVKFVVFVEDKAVCSDLADVVWRVANNTDPARDCFYVSTADPVNSTTLFIDGTRKTAELDGFTRDWPNIVCSSSEIISFVDQRWNDYNIGDFLESPSAKYRKQLYEGEAIVKQ